MIARRPPRRTAAGLLPVLALALVLAACGGGGGAGGGGSAEGEADRGVGTSPPAADEGGSPDSPDGSDSPDSPDSPGSPDSEAPDPPAVDLGCGATAFREDVLQRLNQRRAAGATCGGERFGAAAALGWSDDLARAALAHSRDMATRDYFSHTSPEGGTMQQRVEAAGYAWSRLGENIAAGYPDAASVVQGWMDSPGHCRNVMDPDFSQAGMACASDAGSRYGRYYTLDLGRPR